MKINEDNLRMVIKGKMEDTRLSLAHLAEISGLGLTELYGFISGQHISLRSFVSLCDSLNLVMEV